MQQYLHFFIITLICSSVAFSSFSFAQTNQNKTETEVQAEPNDQDGDFRWVSDDLFTYLRAGPSKGYRLLGTVKAGTKVQLLQVNNEAEYAEIRDDRQRTGWIEVDFLSDKKSVKDELEELTILLKDRTERLQISQADLQTTKKNLSAADSHKTKLNRQVTQQLEELARINEQIEKRERTSNMAWFTRGSILAIIALLIGYLLGVTGRRRKTHNHLL